MCIQCSKESEDVICVECEDSNVKAWDLLHPDDNPCNDPDCSCNW